METLDPQQAVDNLRAAVEAGLLKIMSKMGCH
jgi:glutamate synthase domain-containing protein 2